MKSNELTQIVSHYIANKRDKAHAERRWFLIQPTLEVAISKAAMALTPKNKRFKHQRRIPGAVLRQSERALLDAASALQESETFEELHQTVSRTIGGIHGIGELTIYDTTLRIGAKLGLEPSVVFLHSGTRIGARALGFDGSQEFIDRKMFPREFGPLSPEEIEDVLCIYKDRLAKKKRGQIGDCN